MTKKIILTLVLIFFAGGLSSTAHARRPHRWKHYEMEEVEPEIAEKEWVRYAPAEGIRIPSLDVKITPYNVFVFQGTPNPNTGKSGKFGMSWVLYMDIEKRFEDWGLAFVQLKPGWGDSVQRDLDLFSNVDYNATDMGGNIRCKKFRYEQYLFDRQLILACGKCDATKKVHQNRFAWDDDTQFLNWMFNKFPAVEWPSNYGFTIHTEMCPKAISFLELGFNFFEGDSDWQKIFDQGIYTAQVNLKPASLLDLDPEQWEGNYRFYGWVNSRHHGKLVKSGEQPSTDTKEINYGLGVSFDQSLTDVFGLFCRIGWQRPDLIPADGGATISLAWEAGMQMTGKYWNRKDDVLGLGAGQLVPSRQYKDAGHPGKAEGHFEVYYNFRLNKVCQISPDFQVIWTPGGVSKSDDNPVFAYGVRVLLDM